MLTQLSGSDRLIHIDDEFRTLYCGMGLVYYNHGQPDLDQVVSGLYMTDKITDRPILLAKYQTRVIEGPGGLYFEMLLPTIDEADQDISRDIELLAYEPEIFAEGVPGFDISNIPTVMEFLRDGGFKPSCG